MNLFKAYKIEMEAVVLLLFLWFLLDTIFDIEHSISTRAIFTLVFCKLVPSIYFKVPVFQNYCKYIYSKILNLNA